MIKVQAANGENQEFKEATYFNAYVPDNCNISVVYIYEGVSPYNINNLIAYFTNPISVVKVNVAEKHRTWPDQGTN